MSWSELDGWIPCRIHWQPQGPVVEWCYLGADRLTEPFFEMSMRRLLDRPFRALFRRQTPIRVLEERAAAYPGIRPTGFILHQSRCGSTLVSRMLAALPRNVVVSEAGCVEDLIWAASWLRGLPVEMLANWLRALIAALGQPRAGSESRYFVKFDALQTLALPLLKIAFPDTPWVFLYRDPVEILVSVVRQPPVFATPGVPIAGFLPIAADEAMAMVPEEHAARVLQQIGVAAAGALERGDGLAVNYSELPSAVTGRIGTHFRIEWEEQELVAMEHASRFHAKAPSTPFVADRERKQREAGRDLRNWAAKWLEGTYQRLETARDGSRAGRD